MIPWEHDDGHTPADDEPRGRVWGWVFAGWVALACAAVGVWVVLS